MKKIFINFFLIVSLGVLSTTAYCQGYDINVTVHGIQDTTIILGHYLNKSMYPDDTVWVDHKGNGVFKGKNELPGGMYIVFLPTQKYFEFLMGKDQKFSIEVDTSDFINTMTVKGSDENQIFSDFQKFMVKLRKRAGSLQDQRKKATTDKAKQEVAKKLDELNKERLDYIHKIIMDHPDLFVSAFLKATLDIEVPDPPKDKNGKIIDSTWQYRYYKKHYFDNFDVSDPRLLHTPLYEDKILTYVDKVIPQIPDSIIPEVDMLVDKSKSDSSLFRYMLITLFNHYGESQIMGMDAVQIHLAEKYYLTQAWWSSKKFLDELKERVKVTKPLLIGKFAPDIQLLLVPTDHFMAAENDTALKRYPHAGSFMNLYDIDADYTVLIFWEADCGHCKKAVPELYDLYEKDLKNRGVKVLAVSTLFGEDGKIKWVDFVNQHKLYDWMNAWNPYDYKFKITYDVRSTPQIFILDRDKKILAKRIGVEQVKDIIDTLTKEKKN